MKGLGTVVNLDAHFGLSARTQSVLNVNIDICHIVCKNERGPEKVVLLDAGNLANIKLKWIAISPPFL